jgi:hypothetical protein
MLERRQTYLNLLGLSSMVLCGVEQLDRQFARRSF